MLALNAIVFRASRACRYSSPAPRLHKLWAALMAVGLASSSALAAPEGGVVRAGDAAIVRDGLRTDINQSSSRAVIDWRSFSVDAPERVHFNQLNVTSSTLNRVTGAQVSNILGTLIAKGQVILVNPNGIVFGQGARVDVGSLIATTSRISNENFLAGKLQFTPGNPGAGIVQKGTITAVDGGLVALVAPHVRNDGVIQARLGKVTLASGDAFTIDLAGDQLVSLALSDAHVGQLLDGEGKPVTLLINQAGKIDADGGKVVLVGAGTAKAVVDDVINMSGVIKADSVGTANGQIVLLGNAGTVSVSGGLSASGARAGEAGGSIQVVGDAVKIATSARLNTWGATRGGSVQAGGDASTGGIEVKTQSVEVAAGALIDARARDAGDGGGVVVSAEKETNFRGSAFARAGEGGGKGGRIEVSSRNNLSYDGDADAGAPSGEAGTLLLRSRSADVQTGEADAISRTLRTGTKVSLVADEEMQINARIDGRGGVYGAELDISAGKDLNIGRDIITADGAIRAESIDGALLMCSINKCDDNDGEGSLDGARNRPIIFSSGRPGSLGGQPITLSARGNVQAYDLITRGDVSVTSREGNVWLFSKLGYVPDYPLGSLVVRAEDRDAPGDVFMTDVKALNIDVRAERNVQLLDPSEEDKFQGLLGAETLSLQSRLMGNLLENEGYTSNPSIRYTGPGADNQWQTLTDNEGNSSLPGILPPGPTQVLPGATALREITPPGFELLARSTPSTAGIALPDPVETPSRAEVALTDVVREAGLRQGPAFQDSQVDSLLVSMLQPTALQTGKSETSEWIVEPDVISGGQGVARSVDIGRGEGGDPGRDVFAEQTHVVEGAPCEPGSGSPHGYFGRDAFGQSFPVSCN